ncbi:MAG: hypothetical protein QGI86_27180, partial [Candidatus Poribacteria bacterium]|nr:hypothetical protein [Candidatus Poribacteria bacterium]
QPGVELKFSADTGILVNGELIARGTADQPITFTSGAGTPAAGDWSGLVFAETATDAVLDEAGNYQSGCLLQHCNIVVKD